MKNDRLTNIWVSYQRNTTAANMIDRSSRVMTLHMVISIWLFRREYLLSAVSTGSIQHYRPTFNLRSGVQLKLCFDGVDEQSIELDDFFTGIAHEVIVLIVIRGVKPLL